MKAKQLIDSIVEAEPRFTNRAQKDAYLRKNGMLRRSDYPNAAAFYKAVEAGQEDEAPELSDFDKAVNARYAARKAAMLAGTKTESLASRMIGEAAFATTVKDVLAKAYDESTTLNKFFNDNKLEIVRNKTGDAFTIVVDDAKQTPLLAVSNKTSANEHDGAKTVIGKSGLQLADLSDGDSILDKFDDAVCAVFGATDVDYDPFDL